MKKLVLTFLSFLLVGCSNFNFSSNKNKAVYFSIMTSYLDKKIKNHIYTYDLQTKKLELKATIQASNNYPLGSYYKNYIYYVKKPRGNNFVNSSYVFRRNVKTNKEEVMSAEYSRFNDLRVLGRDSLFIVGLNKQNPIMTPAISSLHKFDPFNWNKSEFVHSSNYNPHTSEIIVTSNDYNKEISEMKAVNNGEKKSIQLTSTITSIKNSKKTTITTINKRIQTIYNTSDTLYYVARTTPITYDDALYSMDIDNHQEVLISKLTDYKIKQILYVQANKLYFIGNNNKLYGIYELNLKDKKVTSLISFKSEVTNNGSVYLK